MAAHARLSASGSKRWLSCPPSAKLEQSFPDSQSTYAAEGTQAHELAERLLRCYLSGNDGADVEEASAFLNECTKEMADHVQTYVDICIEKINAARAVSKDAIILLEQRLDYSAWVPEGFGTGDVVIIADGKTEVVDLKYGKGVPVEAEGNTQMRLYGLGALHQFDFLYGIEEITMTIVQPRLDSISSETLTSNELLDWAETVVRPKAKLAWAGEGEFSAGDHCKFCRANPTCRARAEENMKLAALDFQEPFLLEPSEIGEILGKLDRFIAWAKDVQDYALDQAVNHGVTWPGWKVVEGTSRRKYADEVAVATALLAAGYKDEVIYEKSLHGITKMTELLGKKPFNALLTSYIVKPPGKPTLAPENDKRPAINSVAAAQADFAEGGQA